MKKKTKNKINLSAFEAGMETQQVLIDSLCEQFHGSADNIDILSALNGAFRGLIGNTEILFKKKEALTMLRVMIKFVEESPDLTCNDCKEKVLIETVH
jgi:hypothetical protein